MATEQHSTADQHDLSAQTVSSLMDDVEITEFGLRRLLNDEQMQQTWWRYHTIGDIMRDDSSVWADSDISAAISAALDDEVSHKAGQNWWRHIGGAAVAASVALAVLVSVQFTANPDTGNVIAEDGAKPTADSLVSTLSTQELSELERINEFLMLQTEMNTRTQGAGSQPFPSVVSNQRLVPLQAAPANATAKDKQATDAEQKKTSEEQADTEQRNPPLQFVPGI